VDIGIDVATSSSSRETRQQQRGRFRKLLQQTVSTTATLWLLPSDFWRTCDTRQKKGRTNTDTFIPQRKHRRRRNRTPLLITALFESLPADLSSISYAGHDAERIFETAHYPIAELACPAFGFADTFGAVIA
jgi:hypothetical protein